MISRNEMQQALGVERIYDYTKFHVGLYSSLVFGVVALVGLGDGDVLQNPIVIYLTTTAIILWVVSGMAGGVILGTLIDFEGSIQSFRNHACGPFGYKALRGKTWESIEHKSFWAGAIVALAAFLYAVLCVLPMEQTQSSKVWDDATPIQQIFLQDETCSSANSRESSDAD